ncbi:xin actin-binding repeat-containing protein 1 isoform X4 [Gadus macrocephalus]|uniref:xin actin-binding repeat-containing protein 1 isoform X4 n=1 Tax=Gadus macrocephalus TaxID=80720 RepID=UPI0028CBA7A7|nr:xin actin-binding repeat-containing protein 1 isoform X4 [Gadus macrocephalus]
MAMHNIRKSQSLKNLSGNPEASWLKTSNHLSLNRKSVLQLVQQYQSTGDLRNCEKAELEADPLEGGGSPQEGSFPLCRSRSVEHLAGREPVVSGTSALRDLFESKSSLRQDYGSSPRLHTAPVIGGHSLVAGIGQSASERNTGPQKEVKDENSHRDTTNDVLPEASFRSPKYPHEGQKTQPLTQRDFRTQRDSRSPSRPDQDSPTGSTSVRDRSALYLSRVAATDHAGSPAPPEFLGTSEPRRKASKFQLPTKEMCSACLTPVYPMEKMVANKLILHKKCFCCKHCQKTLSLHNYSSLYGDFFCIFHYQQLFKRKGNYDEGFGHMQHKDRWLQKTTKTDEHDVKKVPNISQLRSNVAEGLESNSNVLSTKSGSKNPLGIEQPIDIRDRKKIIWPPQKKQTICSVAQQSYITTGRNKMPDNGKPPAFSNNTMTLKYNDADKKESKMAKGQLKDTEGEISARTSRSSISGVNEPIDAQHIKAPGNLQWKETNSSTFSNKLKLEYIDKTVVDSSSPCLGKGIAITEHNTKDLIMKPTTIDIDHSMAEDQICIPSKTKKTVRFAPNVVESSQSPSDLCSEAEEISESESSQGKVDNVITHNPYEYRHNQKSNNPSDQQLANVETRQEIPNSEEDSLNRLQEKGESQTDDVNVHSTNDEKQASAQEMAKILDDTEDTSVAHSESAKQTKMEQQQGHLESEERSSEGSTTRTEQGAPPLKTVTGVKSVIQKSNSLKGSPAKPNDKKIIKKGSWSKEKSPRSQLFTSGGSESGSKTGGILGKFFKSSTGKGIKQTKSQKVEEGKEAVQAEEKSTGRDRGMTEEMAKDEVKLLETFSEQESVNDVKEDTHATAMNSFDITEVTPPLKPPRSDLTADHQSDITSPAHSASLEPAESTNPSVNPQANSETSETDELFAIKETSGENTEGPPHMSCVENSDNTNLIANPQSRKTAAEYPEHNRMVSHETIDLSATQDASGEKDALPYISSAEHADNANLLDTAPSNPQSHETIDLSLLEDDSEENTKLFTNPQSSEESLEHNMLVSHEAIDFSVIEDASVENTNLFAHPQSRAIVDIFSTEDDSGGKPNIVSAENTDNTNLFDNPVGRETLDPSLIEHDMLVSYNTSTVVQAMIKDPYGSTCQSISDDPFQEEPQSIEEDLSSSEQSFISASDTNTSVPILPIQVVDVQEFVAGPRCDASSSNVDHVTPQETEDPFTSSDAQTIITSSSTTSTITDDIFGLSLGHGVLTNETPAECTDPFEMIQHNTADNTGGIGSLTVQPFVGLDPTPVAWRESPSSIDPWSFGSNSQTGEPEVQPDFDIFSSGNCAFSAPPAGDVFDLSSPEASASFQLSDDIFGVSDPFASGADIFTVQQPSGTNSGTVSNILGLDSSSITDHPVESNPLMGDIVSLEAGNQAISSTNTETNFFGDLCSSTEQKTENPAPNNSWMDDLFG